MDHVAARGHDVRQDYRREVTPIPGGHGRRKDLAHGRAVRAMARYGMPRTIAPTMTAWTARLLSVLRIVAALLYLMHGTSKLLALPPVRDGATVRSGRCSYAVRTRQPTGVLEIDAQSRLTLGDLFAVWGRPLSRFRLAGYRARPGERIRAWVGGCPWTGRLRAIPLRRHAQIVLEGGGYVPPHATFLFPPGL